ncbi:MAG: TonB family protein [Myxococcota bacterium]
MLFPFLLSAAFAQEAPAEEPPPLVKLPELEEYVQAPYPPEAEAAGIEGTVRLLLEIGETGEVNYVEVLEPAGHGFDEAAVEAAWQFYFSPAEDANGPTPVAIEFDYGFVLEAPVEEAPDPEEPPPPAPVNLEGQVVEMGTRRPLPDIGVQLRGSSGALLDETTTDAEGRYEFRGAPIGEVVLRGVYPGYRDVEEPVEVTAGEITAVQLWIRNLSYRDDEVVGIYEREREAEVTRRTLTVEEVRRVPGTFGDPVRVIQSLPGASRSPFGTGGLIIRGANPEDSRVYIDGVEVPIVYHLGGIVSVLNADLIEAVDYLPGGYRVRYGRGMGGVVDVRTKTAFPEQNELMWNTDLLDSGGLFQGRVGKDRQIGVAVAARRSYIDAVLAPLSDTIGVSLLPRWYDYQIKIEPLDFKLGRLSLFAFGYQDRLLFSAPEDTAFTPSNLVDDDLSARYGAHRLVMRWDAPLGKNAEIRTTTALGYDDVAFNVTDDLQIFQSAPVFTMRVEVPWQLNEALLIKPGIDHQSSLYDTRVRVPFSAEQLVSFDPLAETDPTELTFDGWAASPDPFLDMELRPLKDKDTLLLNPGLRLTTLRLDGYFNTELDPRFAFQWNVGGGGTLKGSTGLYHQPPLGQDLGEGEENIDIGFEQAWSSEIGWRQRFSPAFQGDVTVFHREITDRIVTNPDFGEDDRPLSVNDGLGRVTGMELLVRRAPVDRFFGWVSYTLSRAERKDNPNDPEWYLFDFDQTHILTAVGGFDLPYDIGISSRVQYVTGNPYTPFAGGVYDIDQDVYTGYQTGLQNEERLPAFFAVDGRVDKLFTFKKWQLEVFVDLLNAITGENPEQVQYNYDFSEQAFITGLPFIPSPGFNAEFHF